MKSFDKASMMNSSNSWTRDPSVTLQCVPTQVIAIKVVLVQSAASMGSITESSTFPAYDDGRRRNSD